MRDAEDHFPSDGKHFGLQVEIEDRDEDWVIMFEPKEGKRYPSHVGGEDGVVRVKRKQGQLMVSAMLKGSGGQK